MNVVLEYRRSALALIAASQIFSPVLLVPGTESVGGSVFRLVLILLAGILAVTIGFRPVSLWPRRALIAVGLLGVWLLVSLAWSSDLQSGLRQISYAVTIMLLIYSVEMLVRDRSDFLWLARTIAWLGAVIIVLSFYELWTGNHFFRSSLQDIAESDRSLSYVSENQAWFTFGNPNDLAVHLAFCCFASALFFAKSKAVSLAVLAYFAAVIYLADALDARIVIVALAAFAGLGAVSALQARAKTAAFLTGWAVLAGVVALVLGLVLIDRAEFLDVSTFIRLQLVVSAMEMAAETLFVGIGAGAFEAEMWFGGFIGRTYGIVNPHNAVARMLAESGVVGLALFGFLLLGPIAALGRAGRATRFSAFVAGATIGLPLLFSVGSDPLSSSSLQFALAVLWVGCRLAAEEGNKRTDDTGSVLFSHNDPYARQGFTA